MTLPIIDTHAHLYMEEFDDDRSQAIDRARQAGVRHIVNIGIDLESSLRAIRLAEAHDDLSATVGFHPHDAAAMTAADIERLADAARHPKVVAIGEIGLDFYRNRSPREAQFQALGWQLELARRLSLPIVVHSRAADAETLAALREWSASSPLDDARPIGVIHCFNSDAAVAREYVEMGFHIAVGAYVGYPGSKSPEAVRSVPADRLVVETDCPFLPPQARRGQRNEPAYLPATIEAVAAIRGQSPQEVAAETTRNACRLFSLPEPVGKPG